MGTLSAFSEIVMAASQCLIRAGRRKSGIGTQVDGIIAGLYTNTRV